MHLAAALAALLLAADPEVVYPAATPAPPAALPATPAPDRAAAPGETFPPISFRGAAAIGVTREMGKDDGNVTLLSAAVLFRAGPLVLGPELGAHWFPGAPGGSSGARGVSASLLLGSGLLLSPKLRLGGLAEAGFQTYWLSHEDFTGTFSGGDGQAPFLGARLGLDYSFRPGSHVGLHAAFRHTLGSSTETYTKTFGGLPMENGQIRYGGFTAGLEAVVWLGLGAGGATPP
jgi:hypothetical protein